MRGAPLLVLILLLVGAMQVTPVADAAQTLTILWEEAGGATTSEWTQGKIVLPSDTHAYSIGLERRACFTGTHSAMVFDDWAASTALGTITHRRAQYLAGDVTGVRVTVRAAGVDLESGSETTPDGVCAWMRSYLPFETPTEVHDFRFTVAFRHATETYAKVWIVADDTVAPASFTTSVGTGTFLVTERDLAGGDELRGIASVRSDARAIVPMASGPLALLSWSGDVGAVELTDPAGVRCTYQDVLISLRSGSCARFEDGHGAGDWRVRIPHDVGVGRGRFVWAGVDLTPLA